MTSIYDLPKPSEQAFLRSQRLDKEIKNEIEQKGFLNFADFMALLLYHPGLGYYSAAETTIGKSGDFITAPTLTPLFAQCFGKQCQQILSTLSLKNIYEWGAGTGQFAADLLSELKRLDTLPEHYYIYEISDPLRLKQQALLKEKHPDFFKHIIWLYELPHELSGIVIANEVLDALPVNRFRITDEHIEELGVGVKDDQYIWQAIKPSSDLLLKEAIKIKQQFSLGPGFQSEINLHLDSFIAEILKNMREGIIFFVDYGYGSAEYYHPQRSQGTLATFYKHHRIDNPFLYPGLQDVTAHVDFTRVIEEAVKYEGELLGFTTQAAFLLSLGLLDLAALHEQALTEAEKFNLHHAIKLLTLPTEMGERIKVMAISKRLTLSLTGFHLKDRRRDL